MKKFKSNFLMEKSLKLGHACWRKRIETRTAFRGDLPVPATSFWLWRGGESSITGSDN
jgi:hypothetical protein